MPTTAATPPKHRATRVLIVDDHEWVRTALTAALTSEGMRVVGSCVDGIDAVTACRRLHPDAVVMDLRMPAMDGVAATARILAERPTTRIVIVTAAGPGPLLDAAMAAGAAAYALKEDGIHAVIIAIRGT